MNGYAAVLELPQKGALGNFMVDGGRPLEVLDSIPEQ
jgi:hypothetical protein